MKSEWRIECRCPECDGLNSKQKFGLYPMPNKIRFHCIYCGTRFLYTHKSGRITRAEKERK